MPDEVEQEKIAAYFDDLDNLITLHQRKQSCNTLLINVWEQRKLGELASFSKGSGYSKSDLTDAGTPIILYGRLYTKYETVISKVDTFADAKSGSVYSKGGEVIVPGSGETAEDISIASVVENAGVLLGGDLNIITPPEEIDSAFLAISISNGKPHKDMAKMAQGKSVVHLHNSDLGKIDLPYPSHGGTKKNKWYLCQSRQPYHPSSACVSLHKKEDLQMNQTTVNGSTTLFCDYYKQWITVYKEGAIRPVTMNKYHMAHHWLEKLVPKLTLGDLDRFAYQKLLNDYASEHERQTTMDFHHHLKCAILDAVDEGLIQRDPTRKAIIKGKTPREKKPKYLNQYELHKLLDDLDLKSEINLDWLLLLIAKTGMRFSEALALTPKDFDLSRQMLSVSKTWDYKGNGGFLPTKNESSIRKIPLDWQTVMQFAELVRQLPEDEPIFIKGNIYNSTVNDLLARHCKKVEIPVISVHGLRHTHASLLLFAGVSIASVARRLGHSDMTTTQKTYLHIIQELESKDIDIIMRSLSNLNS